MHFPPQGLARWHQPLLQGEEKQHQHDLTPLQPGGGGCYKQTKMAGMTTFSAVSPRRSTWVTSAPASSRQTISWMSPVLQTISLLHSPPAASLLTWPP